MPHWCFYWNSKHTFFIARFTLCCSCSIFSILFISFFFFSFFCKLDYLHSFYQKWTLPNIFEKCSKSICKRQCCLKSIRIRSFSVSCFLVFGLNAERCFLSLRIHSECGETRIRKISNMGTFYAVRILHWK